MMRLFLFKPGVKVRFVTAANGDFLGADQYRFIPDLVNF